MKAVRDIIREYLVANGYDGLCSEECGCGLDDLMPCEYGIQHCVPAEKVIATAEHYDPEFSEFGIGDEIYVPDERKETPCD